MSKHDLEREESAWRVERGDRDPVTLYIDRLAPRSRRTMRRSLDAIACLISGLDEEQIDASTFRWESLTPQLTAGIGERLLVRGNVRGHVRGRGLAPATVNKMLAALRGVLGACRDLKLIDPERYQRLAGFKKLPADAQPDSRCLSDKEVDLLTKTVDTDGSTSGRRDAVVLHVFLCCGPRRSEVAELQVCDYRPESGELVIQGNKPHRERTVPLDAPTREAIDRWLDVRGRDPGPLLLPVNKSDLIQPPPPPEVVLRSSSGELETAAFSEHPTSGASGGGGSGGVGDQGVYEILRRLGRRAGLETVRSRDLRRTAVVRMIRSGLDYEQVQHRSGRMSWLTPEAYQTLQREAQGSARSSGPD